MDGAGEPAEDPAAGEWVRGGAGEGYPPVSLAAKIDRLFHTTHPPGSTGEYTYEQVAAGIAERGGPTISASYLYLLRRGLRDNPTKRHLEALAGFFGVPPGYFLTTHDPTEEKRLELLSTLRDPRVHTLVMTAAALPDAELDIVTQLVTLVGDLDAIRGAARRRGALVDAGTVGREVPDDGPSPRERDQAIELELSYARINLQDGQAAEALRRLSALTETGELGRPQRDEVAWLTAHAHEALGEPEQALTILQRKLDECLDGSSQFPLALVGEQVCQLSLDAGEDLLVVDVGRRTLAGLEERGLRGTGDHLRLAATVMDAHLNLGQLLHASALAQQILALAENLGDPQRQAWTYLHCAQVAESRGRLDEAVLLSNRALSLVSNADDPAPTGLDAPRLQLAAASCLLLSTHPAGIAPPGAATDGTLGGTPDGIAAGIPGGIGREPVETMSAAVAALEAARTGIGARGTPVDRGRWAGLRAVVDLLLGEPVAAEVNARKALAALSGLAHPATVEAHLVLGDALRAQGRHAHADAAHVQAGRVLAGLPGHQQSRWSAGVWRSLGDRWRLHGSAEQAAEAYRQALDAADLRATRPEPQPLDGGVRP
jgi:tetratricopeptide (TPR) repeat protein/transcriptional regulator with XRE-family HTH domain